VFGDGGTGKSLLMQQLLTACATGSTFLGHPVTPCKVFAVFCEDDGDELGRRQAAINKASGVDFVTVATNARWISRVDSENLLMTFKGDGRGDPTVFFEQIRMQAMLFGAQLVIIDTAADTFGGNENSRSQVRQFIALLSRLAREIDGAVVLLAHPSRTGISERGDGGSTAWSNTSRSRLWLKMLGKDSDPDLRILSREKANYAGLDDALTLQFQEGIFVNVTKPTRLGPRESAALLRRKADEAFEKGLAELTNKRIRGNDKKGQSNYAPKMLCERATECEDFSKEQLEGAMNRLLKSGKVAIRETGPPSRRRSYLEVVEPKLPEM
jgi:RecA-family ATPase